MFKQLLLWTFGTFILLQAIQIDIPEPPKTIDPDKEIQAPKEIMSMLKTSCYDCHSYQTKMPWYGNISPVSLEVKSHIKEGRLAANFQEWGNYDDTKKQKIYKGITKTINFRMPMPMYLTMHEEAKLTQKERNQIKDWAKGHIKKEEY
ncbi:heme-binding domain-containing protein [Sulfurovum sp.]|uniref:heme-binding domain-containing protein n=1 Tax=Sulfurovum sp. TaxID=1969726 RepID=UPI0025D13F4C|nr:heme-binding domain-containing protein [Sulfurovum sp.]